MIELGDNYNLEIEDEQIRVTRDICLFGARGDCNQNGLERMEFCVIGKYKSCEYYQKLREGLEDKRS